MVWERALLAATRPRQSKQGHLTGTIAAEPGEVDETVREQYGRICAGNSSEHDELVRNYCDKCGRYMYRAEEPTMEPLTGDDLYRAAICAKETAVGLDQWSPADLQLLSRKKF